MKNHENYTVEDIILILSNYNRLLVGVYTNGCIDQLELLLDLERVIMLANLTDRQREIIDLYYLEELTQLETAGRLGLTQQAVTDHIQKIKKKIGRVLDSWGVRERGGS